MQLQPRPFDLETAFVRTKRRRTKRPRGPNSPLYAAIWPMVYVVRVFGFAPYEFAQDRLVPSNGYLIFSAFAAVLYSYILYVVFQKFTGVKRELIAVDTTESAKVGNGREKFFQG